MWRGKTKAAELSFSSHQVALLQVCGSTAEGRKTNIPPVLQAVGNTLPVAMSFHSKKAVRHQPGTIAVNACVKHPFIDPVHALGFTSFLGLSPKCRCGKFLHLDQDIFSGQVIGSVSFPGAYRATAPT